MSGGCTLALRRKYILHWETHLIFRPLRTDNNFQMLINYALVTKENAVAQKLAYDPNTVPFQLCYACPVNLDFTMHSEIIPQCEHAIPVD